jgi:hypothetical protein
MRGRGEKLQAEEADWMKRLKMVEEKIEQREKKDRKNNDIITGIGRIRRNIERVVEEWLEREIGVKVNVKQAFKINKDKMMLAKIESWEQKKNIFNSFSVECPYLLSKLLIKVPAFNCRRCEVFELRSARTNVLLMSPLYQMVNSCSTKADSNKIDIFFTRPSELRSVLTYAS